MNEINEFALKLQKLEINGKVLDMSYENFRIETYRGWSIPYIEIRELALNGFYLKTPGSFVKCVFCPYAVTIWRVYDKIIKEHKLWSPLCPFLNNIKQCGNISIEDQQINNLK